ncbi:DNA replication complex GINS protein PSF1 isoform X2 [Halyomorpha halys]|nr:DNA replication complex GINS protein PSF1-like isoform X2 [Halyomorpha halys]
MRILNQFVEEAMNSPFDPVRNNFITGVRARQAALERNKRCLLAYQWNRLQKLRQMRWEFGSVLPPDLKTHLSEGEVTWFNKYNKCLTSYMKSIGGKNGLNLLQDSKPPKELFIEVRCLTNYGKIELENGEVIMLNKNSQHYMPRSQCETLIRQGVLEQIL